MGRVLGLDVGDRTIGVAVSDEGGVVALGLHTIRRTKDLNVDVAAVGALATEYGVVRLVVGWPLQLNGEPGAQAQKVVKVARVLKARLGLPIERFDERLTTVTAERALLEGNVRRAERKKVVDTVAATLILQGWLDRRGQIRAQGPGDPPAVAAVEVDSTPDP
jgi:putative Holliday junction resolvase